MRYFLLVLLLIPTIQLRAASIFVEAENFAKSGGWVLDQQFMDQMGSPYLLAHGLGKAVADASTTITFPQKGTYYVFVRTYNWTSPWYKDEGPGKFVVKIGDKPLPVVLGATGTTWLWQPAGTVRIDRLVSTLSLCDQTGFDGRCDALYFTTEKTDIPPSDVKVLNSFRRKKLQLSDEPQKAGKFDLVVTGGGVAGICAAVSAARLGCKVALIQDRPMLGGNNSSEVRVHLGGRINIGLYPQLGNLLKEFGSAKSGNARAASNYEDDKKMHIVSDEKNISLWLNYHVTAVRMNGKAIDAVIARNTMTGEELMFESDLFADCTGDGSVGALAGADYRMGREGGNEFGETTAPDEADRMTMGASVQWNTVDTGAPVSFPVFQYGLHFTEENCDKITMGDWNWETGMNLNQITEFERIRDYGLLVVYSNWSFLKNELTHNEKFKDRALAWVAYIAGKRESRRLLGDYILREDDLRQNKVYNDGTASATWSIDLHYPDPGNSKFFPDAAYKSIAKHIVIYPYPIPYRCLYSRNVSNLFMAGRDISVTHVALGTTRLMRTGGMLGEVVGMAASLCKKFRVHPRDIYVSHFEALKELMKAGVGKQGLPDNQRYNQGATLFAPPH